ADERRAVGAVPGAVGVALAAGPDRAGQGDLVADRRAVQGHAHAALRGAGAAVHDRVDRGLAAVVGVAVAVGPARGARQAAFAVGAGGRGVGAGAARGLAVAAVL